MMKEVEQLSAKTILAVTLKVLINLKLLFEARNPIFSFSQTFRKLFEIIFMKKIFRVKILFQFVTCGKVEFNPLSKIKFGLGWQRGAQKYGRKIKAN